MEREEARMAEDVIKDLHGRIEKALTDLQRELSKIRTGRANPAILEGIKVDYYGTLTPLSGVGTIHVPDARLITIKPWDRSAIQAIEKAINEAGIGINPSNDGETVRLPIPALTEERRKDIVKKIGRAHV
jgi:ribosome recycling factor